MKRLNQEQIKQLLSIKEEPMISVYLPTHYAGTKIDEDKLRYKNLLKKSEKDLRKMGYYPNDLGDNMTEAENLLANGLFWSRQSNGLAVFISKSFYAHFELPEVFQEFQFVGDHFYIKPLIPFLKSHMKYYILLLSQKKIKFYEAGRYFINERELVNTPKTIEELIQFNDYEEQIQAHSLQFGRMPGSQDIFHGQGSNADLKRVKKTIDIFIKELEKGLEKNIGSEKTPIVLVGDEYLRGVMAERRKFNYVAKGVPYNPYDSDKQEIHKRSWQLMQDVFEQDMEKNLEYLYNMHDSGKMTTNETELVPDAFQGRINKLFVDINENLWGKMDIDKNRLEVHVQAQEGDRDLLDLAAWQTLKYDGDVYYVPREKIPGNNKMAAILRY